MALVPPDWSIGRVLLPELINIVLRRPASLSGGAESTIPVARVHEQAGREEDVDSPMGGALSGTRRVFHLWKVECAALPPFQDYEIQKVDGTVWVIKEVETLAHGNRFRCQTLAKP